MSGFLVVVMAFTWLAAVTSTAEATASADPNYWKQTAERRSTVYRLVYSQSPQSVPSTYDPVREAEEVLRQQQRTLPASNPKVPSLWQQLRTTTVRSGLSTPLRALGTVALVAGTFEVGWKLGSGINAKFLKVGVPEPPAPGNYNQSSPTITYFQQGTGLGVWYKHEMPYDGWAFSTYAPEASGQRVYEFYVPPTIWPYWCPLNSGPGGPFQSLIAPAEQYECGGSAQLAAYVAPENALSAAGPVETYTDQPYTQSSEAPSAPAQNTAEAAVTGELDKPEHSDLRNWLNYKLGSPGAQDPTGEGDPNPEIEFPDYVEHWIEHGHEFLAPDSTPLYDDPAEYWRDAADIVERYTTNPTNPDILRCTRTEEGRQDDVYWDADKQAIVIVKNGKIVTYFKPGGDGFQYWLDQCD